METKQVMGTTTERLSALAAYVTIPEITLPAPPESAWRRLAAGVSALWGRLRAWLWGLGRGAAGKEARLLPLLERLVSQQQMSPGEYALLLSRITLDAEMHEESRRALERGRLSRADYELIGSDAKTLKRPAERPLRKAPPPRPVTADVAEPEMPTLLDLRPFSEDGDRAG